MCLVFDFSTLMKKFLLQIFTVLALASLVTEDVYKCFGSCEGMEILSCDEGEKDAKKESKEDDTQGKSFKIKISEQLLSLTNLSSVHHTGTPEDYSKQFHSCAPLSIFSPPPNFC